MRMGRASCWVRPFYSFSDINLLVERVEFIYRATTVSPPVKTSVNTLIDPKCEAIAGIIRLKSPRLRHKVNRNAKRKRAVINKL